MWKDPIIEEVRKLREQYATEHKNDIDAIFEDIQKRQTQSENKLVFIGVLAVVIIIVAAEVVIRCGVWNVSIVT